MRGGKKTAPSLAPSRHWHLLKSLNPVSTRKGLIFLWPAWQLWLLLQLQHRWWAQRGRNGSCVHKREIQSGKKSYKTWLQLRCHMPHREQAGLEKCSMLVVLSECWGR